MNRIDNIIKRKKRFSIVDESTRILIVEDNPDHATLAQVVLNQNGYQDIDVASSVSEAFIKINSKEYDILLVDYSLADGYGIKLVEWVSKSCSIIMMSGYEDGETAIESFLNEGVKYIIKDASFRYSLCEIIEKAIQNTKLIPV